MEKISVTEERDKSRKGGSNDMKGKMKLKQNSFLLLVTILLFFIMYGTAVC